jgi:pyridinium-3,5-biscarboxylic acid mononucleotide sulfurtransferase
MIDTTPQTLDEKLTALRSYIRSLGSVLVAYSGGVDSGLLAWVAHQELGNAMLAVLADSPSLARSQKRDALAFAEEHGIPLTVLNTAEFNNPEYVRNDGARCFHCKDELFGAMEQFRRQTQHKAIAYGVNVDDQGDYRPGQKAAQQHGVAAPLLEAGLTKAEVRQLARDAGLRIWNKPASPCLSSRIEYGRAVTPEALAAVEQGEEALRELGFEQFRARHHGDIVRIEMAPDELPRAMTPEMAAEFSRIFKSLGFKYVTLDLEGFRSGSMNDILPIESLQARKRA